MAAYYNEIDPFAAQWLRNLIAAGHIAPGDVDERSIEDVRPDDLRGYNQCHFFAGIGVWSLALRRAGWEDSRPIWTGSCPCQPFSASGKSGGFADERHLWPSFAWLIKQCGPGVVAGEQVASKAAEPWLDLVQADLEAMDYAFGALAFPSAGVGAPHIRDRTYWLGYADEQGLQGLSRDGGATGRQGQSRSIAKAGIPGRMADTSHQQHDRAGSYRQTGRLEYTDGSTTERLADTSDGQRQCESNQRPTGLQPQVHGASAAREGFSDHSPSVCGDGDPCPTNGFWADADWLFCRDGKWRPVEPGTFPLVNGPAKELGRLQPGLGRFYGRNRTGRLKGYGNAINADAASAFAATVRSILDEQQPTL